METSPDELWSPDAVDPYNLVPDLAAMAQTVQDALNVLHDSGALRLRGLLSAIPTFGVEGRTYYATDTNEEYFDTGVAWVKVFGPSGVSVRTNTAHVTHAVAYTPLVVAWNLEDFDTDAYHDTTTNNSRLTAPAAGLYRVTAKIRTASIAFNSGVQLGKNGVVDPTARIVGTFSVSAGTFSMVTRTYSLAAGDYIEVFSLGGAASLIVDVAECYAEMVKI